MKLLLGDNFYFNDWAKQVEYNEEYRKNLLKVNGIKYTDNHVEGIDINIEGWFSGNELKLLTANIIDSKLMEGDIGPDVGFMGAVIIKLSDTSRLYKETLAKLVYSFNKVNYIGPVTLYCTIYDDSIYVRQMIARVNKSTVHIILDMLKEDDSVVLDNLHSNLLPKLNLISQYGVGFLIAVPPFPYTVDFPTDTVVDGLTNSNIKHIWLPEMVGNVISTFDGVVGIITARGDFIDNWHPIRDARRRIFRTINNIKVKNLMYRRDVGVRAQEQLEKIKEWL